MLVFEKILVVCPQLLLGHKNRVCHRTDIFKRTTFKSQQCQTAF